MLKEGSAHHNNPLASLGRKLSGFYRWTLRFCLRNPLLIVAFAVLFAGSAYLVFGTLRQELTPAEDRSVVSIGVNAPQTVSLDFTRTQMQKIEERLQPLIDSGEVASIFSISGFGSNTSNGNITLSLVPWEQRARSQQQIAAEVQRLAQDAAPGVRISTRQSNSLGIRGGGSGMQFAVVGSNYDELAETAHAIADAMEEDPRFGRVNVNYNTTQPQLTLTIDREKAAALGIDINGLAPQCRR